jgi:peptidoglycan hydrolase-like protein with peptidoglycan-binding domain
MASRLITTAFALTSAVALMSGLNGCSWMDRNLGTHMSDSSGSSGVSSSGSSGYDRSTGGSTTMVSADQVRQAQQQLTAQGLYNGPIDGVIGPDTRRALQQYQRNHNMQQTATLDGDTLRSLNSQTSSATGARK